MNMTLKLFIWTIETLWIKKVQAIHGHWFDAGGKSSFCLLTSHTCLGHQTCWELGVNLLVQYDELVYMLWIQVKRMTTMVVTADKGSEVSKIYKSVICAHFVQGKYVQDCGLSL